ncbi:MAG: DUF167 domain-containing protein [Dehalococcoidia bacterium]|nr:DUF167 domain-containing protein [Dehalococcoidia bacterium]
MARLRVKVTPRAAREALAGRDAEGWLLVRVTAPPVEGEANAAVTRLLAAVLDVPARDLVLVGGAGSRRKQFEVPLSDGELEERLAQALSRFLR